MKTYTHKNVAITFDELRARFYAAIGAKNLSAPSLDAIKKKIDNEQAVAFVPFKAVDYSNGKFVSINVTHMRKGEDRGSRNEIVFVTDDPRGHYYRERHHVVLDTPDNRALLKAADQLADAVHAQKAVLDKKLEDARFAVPSVLAKDYGVKK